jgi:hypothetical protein
MQKFAIMNLINIRSGPHSFTTVNEDAPIWVSASLDTKQQGLEPVALDISPREGSTSAGGYSLVLPCNLVALGSGDKLPSFDSHMTYRTTVYMSKEQRNTGLVNRTQRKLVSLIAQLGCAKYLLPEGTKVLQREHLWLPKETVVIDGSFYAAFLNVALAIKARLAAVKPGEKLAFDALVWTVMNVDTQKYFANCSDVGAWPGRKGQEAMNSTRYRRDHKDCKK